MDIWTILFIIASYLAGSIPFGYLAGKCRGVDLRKEGSCNIGATNAWRVLGWRWGLPIFILDFLKGFLPVFWISQNPQNTWWGIASVVMVCFAAVLGHTYTCFLKFNGGKGVATTAGVLFALNPLIACVALCVWSVAMGISGIVSLASLVAACAMIVASWCYYPIVQDGCLMPQSCYAFFFSLAGLLVILKHRSNIARLLDGTEPSFYSGKFKK